MFVGSWNLEEKTSDGWKTIEGFTRRAHAKEARKRHLAKINKVEVEDLKSADLGNTKVLVRKGW